MKEEIKDLLVNFGVSTIGHYARYQFSKIKYTFRQNMALILCSMVVVVAVHNTAMAEIYKLCAVMGITLIMPNIVKAVIKAGDKSEDKAADKLSKKIDDIID